MASSVNGKHMWPILDDLLNKRPANGSNSNDHTDLAASRSTMLTNLSTDSSQDLSVYIIHDTRTPPSSSVTNSVTGPSLKLHGSTTSNSVTGLSFDTDTTDPRIKQNGCSGVDTDTVTEGYSFERWNWRLIHRILLVSFLILLISLYVTCISLVVVYSRQCSNERYWWQGTVIYRTNIHRFCRPARGISFLQCAESKIPYVKTLNVKSVQIGNLLESKTDPNGRRLVTNHRNIHSDIGNERDLRRFLDRIRREKLKLILEFPVGFTSIEHEWFIKSKSQNLQTGNQYTQYYIWNNQPSKHVNNSTTGFHENWNYESQRNQYYKSYMDKYNALLNWNSPAVRNDMYKVLQRWLSLGINGIYFKDLEHVEVHRLTDILKLIRSWRSLINSYSSNSVIMVSSEFIDRFKTQTEPNSVDELYKLVDIVDTVIDVNVKNNLTDQFTVEIPRKFIQSKKGSWCLQFGQEFGDTEVSLGNSRLSVGSRGADAIKWWQTGNVWIPTTDRIGNIEKSKPTRDFMKSLLALRVNEAVLMMNGIDSDDDQLFTGYSVKSLRSNTFAIRRYYPRKYSLLTIVNFRRNEIFGDFSDILYRGDVKLDSHGFYSGWNHWNELALKSGQCLLAKQKV
ncbi:uncharacterized protein LOC141902093 isoform X2 [Tubulanus polymorphus]|uniref:uncharacterized protein LOC141902093 isoform X2 n=1 Tax=Tubulanus polymorphus TaxID=672921 RepID=UPI003DA54EB1